MKLLLLAQTVWNSLRNNDSPTPQQHTENFLKSLWLSVNKNILFTQGPSLLCLIFFVLLPFAQLFYIHDKWKDNRYTTVFLKRFSSAFHQSVFPFKWASFFPIFIFLFALALSKSRVFKKALPFVLWIKLILKSNKNP